MADMLPTIETLENRWMRAWVRQDAKELKALTWREFRLVLGSAPPVLLDTKSWLAAAPSDFACSRFRFGDVYARGLGSVVVFAGHLEIDAAIAGVEFSGSFWVTDLWGKSRVRRKWRILERHLSRLDANPELPKAIRRLQLWR